MCTTSSLSCPTARALATSSSLFSGKLTLGLETSADIPRSPDDANVRNKMIYASSKDALHRRLEGIHVDLQCTDYSEITKEASECLILFYANDSSAREGHPPVI